MEQQIRFEKEQFVSGHHGSKSLPEIYSVIFIPSAAYFAWQSGIIPYKNSFIFEFLFLVMPIPISCIIEMNQTIHLLIIFMIMGLIGFFFKPDIDTEMTTSKSLVISKEQNNNDLQDVIESNYRNSITAVRSYLQLMTITAILAVDFRIFPRKFAKTETFGSSLMDIGVGCFVFTQAYVAGRKLKTTRFNFKNFMNILKSVLIILSLGISRTILTKGEHVSEYGVHWNFFYTLAIVPLLSFFIYSFTPNFLPLEIVGTFIMFQYQSLLQYGKLQDYILNAARVDFLSMNKEGIYSCAGYLAIFLISSSLGNRVFKTRYKKTMVFLYALVISILFWIVYIKFDIPISRRMANASFVLWSLSTCCWFTLSFMIVGDMNNTKTAPPQILHFINMNQLPSFLLANVMTGLINLSMNTIEQSDMMAFLIIQVYLFVICYAMNSIGKLNLKLKL